MRTSSSRISGWFRERSSGDRKRITSITKAGSPKMRWALIQSCWVARRWAREDPMVQWALAIERRRGKKVAMVALARKMAGILFAIWRDGTTYDPSRGATADPPPRLARAAGAL